MDFNYYRFKIDCSLKNSIFIFFMFNVFKNNKVIKI